MNFCQSVLRFYDSVIILLFYFLTTDKHSFPLQLYRLEPVCQHTSILLAFLSLQFVEQDSLPVIQYAEMSSQPFALQRLRANREGKELSMILHNLITVNGNKGSIG